MHTFSMAADAGIGLLSLEPNELGRKRTEELQTNLYKRTGAEDLGHYQTQRGGEGRGGEGRGGEGEG